MKEYIKNEFRVSEELEHVMMGLLMKVYFFKTSIDLEVRQAFLHLLSLIFKVWSTNTERDT